MRTIYKYIGKKYNMLEVLGLDYSYRSDSGHLYHKILCLCDCGNETSVEINELKKGNTKSCGCLSNNINNKVIAGEIIGNYKVLEETEPLFSTDGKKKRNFKVECTECNHIREIGSYHLRTREAKCTCPKPKEIKPKKEPKKYIGEKFGKYTIIDKYGYDSKKKTRRVKVRCECGTEKVVTYSYLRKDKPKGCINCSRAKTHGLSKHPLHSKWCSIINRCENPNDKSYSIYGGKGVSMCKEWREDFKKFYDWSIENGWENKLEIDRLDSDGNYEPSNCRYITKAKNSRRSSQSKLDWDKVNFIRENKDKMTTKELATMFSVGSWAIKNVLSYKTWNPAVV